MSTTSATPSPLLPDPSTLSLEQKIEVASEQAAQVASIFSPAVGAAIEAGVSAEPLIMGMIHMFAALFSHHTKQAAK